MRLNEVNIKRITPPQKSYKLIRDDEIPGFAIRITAHNARSFTLSYTIHGRERRMTIGGWPVWSATAARLRAKELRQMVDCGVDPLEEKQQKTAEPTFADLLTEYERIKVPQMRRGSDVMARLNRDVLPVWKWRKLSDITRREVISLVESKAQDAPISANRTLQHVRAVFSFGVKRDWLAANPASYVDLPGGPEKPRDRVLTPQEIYQFWSGLESDTASLTDTMRDVLRLILLTAQRPGEVCRMSWPDVDLEESSWVIPREQSKSKRSHRIPLSGMALELLGKRRRVAETEFVFPSRYRKRHAATSAAAVSNSVLLNRWFGLRHWTPHDLRRTAASHMAASGVPTFTIGRVLGHAESGVTQIHYAHYSYEKEKREALRLWEQRLREILTGKKQNVVAMGFIAS